MRRRSKLLPILPLAALALVLTAVWPDVRPSSAGERVEMRIASVIEDREDATATPDAARPVTAERTLERAPCPAAPAVTARSRVRFGLRLVLDARPLQDGRVSIEGAQPVERNDDPVRWFEADDVGTFPVAVTDLPDGVLPPRHWKYDPLTVTVSRADEVVTLEAVRAAVVHGRVTCPAGPVGPCYIRVTSARTPPDLRWVDPILLECDENGWFAGEVYPGDAVLSVEPRLLPGAPLRRRMLEGARPAYLANFQSPRSRFRSLPVGAPTEVDFEYAKGPRTLSLRLVDRDGTPRPSLRVILFPLQVEADWSEEELDNGMGNGDAGRTSNDEGQVLIRHLLPDEYGLVIEANGYASFTTPGATSLAHRPPIHRIDLVEGDVDRTISVPSPDLRELEVTFVDRESGAPLRGAAVDVILEPRFGRDREVSRRKYLDAEGVLRVWIEDTEEQVLLLVTDRNRTKTYEILWVAQPGPSLPVTAAHQF